MQQNLQECLVSVHSFTPEIVLMCDFVLSSFFTVLGLTRSVMWEHSS